MPNFEVGTIHAKSPALKSIGSSSTEVLAQNLNRVGLELVNISDSTIYLGFTGNVAVLLNGSVITAGGGSWTMDEYNYTNEAVTAIAHTVASLLSVQEYARVK